MAHDTDTYGYDHWDDDTRPGTRRAYFYCWKRYTGWCDTEGRDPWHDPDGETFAAFARAMIRSGLKATTLRQCRAAVAYRYRDPDELNPSPDPLADSPDPTKAEQVNKIMKRVNKRSRKHRPAKALPMTPDVRDRALRASAVRRSGESHDAARLRHLECEATLRLMFDGALRCDDMVRIEWAHVDSDPAANGHRTCYVPPGKTDEPRTANVSPPTWAALQHWHAATPDPAGRITTAATAKTLGERIRRLGEFSGTGITGHSPRRGVLTTAAQDGASQFELMAISGHKSPAVLAEYVDAPHAASNYVTKLQPADPDPAPDGDRSGVGAALRYIGKIMDDSVAMLPYIAGLSMAVALNASRDDPAVAYARDRLIELWPLPDPPPDCARDDCPGFVLTANPRPDERFCCDQCRQIERNARPDGQPERTGHDDRYAARAHHHRPVRRPPRL